MNNASLVVKLAKVNLNASTLLRKKRPPFIKVGILLLILVIVIGLYMHQTISTGMAALTVESNFEAKVYVNGKDKGTTPLEIEVEATEIELTLTSDKPVPSSYSIKVRLGESIKTIVRHKFGESEGSGSTQIITFEKSNRSEALVMAISDPIGVEVYLDNTYLGHTPLETGSTPGVHELLLKKQGYEEEKLSIKTQVNYKLVVTAMLSGQEIATFAPTERIRIMDTPTGFLRLRSQSSATSSEIGQVIPGDVYDVLEKSEDESWQKISLPDGKEGWVSSQYTQSVSDGE